MLTILALHGSGRDETDLIEFCRHLAPEAYIRTPRGSFAQADGFTFVRRQPDRSIAAAEVVKLATDWILHEFETPVGKSEAVIAVGYSSGAIFAEALLAVAPDMFAAAILLRPEPLASGFCFPRMSAKPILIVAGKRDERRLNNDASVLAEQLHEAGAGVSLHVIDAGHGWAQDDKDIVVARSWLATLAAV